ncbi:MAG: hypothetical protein ACREXP_14005 [Steroidobacteraceae bacterium]
MHKYRYRLAAAALLLLTAVSAQACEIWRDKELGIWRGNCKLKDFQVSQTFIGTYQPRLILRWPDLHIRKFKYFVQGSSIEIEADIENLGMGNAAASTLVVDANFGNPLTGVQQGTMQFTVQVPALPLNTSQRVSVGTMYVPTTTQDWDLVLMGVTDPPTMAQPVRGAITESDETNNVRTDTCRWYGPTPDTSVGPCN